jgi:signal transduction histidine kinase
MNQIRHILLCVDDEQFVITSNEGALTVESALGVGTRFTIRLPIQAA